MFAGWGRGEGGGGGSSSGGSSRRSSSRGGGSSSSSRGGGGNRQSKTNFDSFPGDGFEAEDEVFQQSLPPTMPVVRKTIDMLVKLALKQRIFLSLHADKLKLELVKERLGDGDYKLPSGGWTLNGFKLSDEDAIDVVRASPDTLSNLMYTNYKDDTSIWTKLTSWLRFGGDDRRRSGMNVSDDLAFGLAVCEGVEISGHVLAGISYAMSAQTPTVGRPLSRKLAFELISSAHRGRSHSIYLLCGIDHAAQRTASRRTSATLKVDLSLYIHTSLALGGLNGVAVNISGTTSDDLPDSDIDQTELLSMLSKRGVFVASSVSDFVLSNELEVTPERASVVTLQSCDRLLNAANTALTSFFKEEYKLQESLRREDRLTNLQLQIEAEREAEAERVREAEAAREDEAE